MAHETRLGKRQGWKASDVMSVPDHLLDEPDDAICAEHGEPWPCKYCKFEAMMQRAEEERER